MKKFRMLIFTLVMVLLTTISYAYENFNIEVPNFKESSININSSKFGEIKKITWVNTSVPQDKSLLILSTRNQGNKKSSCLYYLNIDRGESKLLYEFPSHKYLDDVILFNNLMMRNSIITAYNEGLIRTTLSLDGNNTLSSYNELIPIEDFVDATSLDYEGNVAFTKHDSNLIYTRKLNNGMLSNYLNNTSSPVDMRYYRKPYYIVNMSSFDNVLTYTSVKKNGINLYSMDNGIPLSKFNRPIIENIISAKKMNNGFGYMGINIKSDSDKSNNTLNVFFFRRFNDFSDRFPNVNKFPYVVDTIPYNFDKFGGIPALNSTGDSNYFSVVYTSYDENHEGTIKFFSYKEQPKSILKDKNLFGPVSIVEMSIDDKNVFLILYFTYENNGVHAKICDIEGKLVKDITDMIK